MKKVRVTSFFGATVAAIALISGCGADSDSADSSVSNDISGSVSEWKIELDATSSKAGEVTFTIENNGTIGHEFMVIKTELSAADLPLEGDHAHHSSGDLDIVGNIAEFESGVTKTLTLNLEAGNYQLVCALPGHLDSGMSVGFTVDAN